tara:strand:- start:226 stop:981 length:756 start_codon:yes stop_codon:yes gene_type:complete
MSNAVDLTVGDLDFSDIAGEKVYLDSKYVVAVKGFGFVNANYIISALRQQLFAHNCHLVQAIGDADFVVEPRVGALGTDSQTITYGIPGNNSLGAFTALLPSVPTVPVLPEISVAKRDGSSGIAKISVFVYDKNELDPIWQSGVNFARSTSNDMWIFGAGPLQWGTIYNQPNFAGHRIDTGVFNIAKWFERPTYLSTAENKPKYHSEFSFNEALEPTVLPAEYQGPLRGPESPVSGEPGVATPPVGALPLK